MNTNDPLNIKPTEEEMYNVIFDYGVYKNVKDVNAKSLRDWIDKTLFTDRFSMTVSREVAQKYSVAMQPVESNQAFKFVCNPKCVEYPDGNHPAKDWMAYLLLLGNLSYNRTIGNRGADPAEMFHYADALTDPSSKYGIAGNAVPLPVFGEMIFNQDKSLRDMFRARTHTAFPSMAFDLEAWDKALKFASNRVAVLSSPAPLDFAHAASARYREISDGNIPVNASVEYNTCKCLGELCKAISNSPEEFKLACVVVAKNPVVASSFSDKDLNVLKDAYKQERELPAEEVQFELDPKDVVDPYDAYEKKYGRIDIPDETPSTKKPEPPSFMDRVGEMMKSIASHFDPSANATMLQNEFLNISMAAVKAGKTPDDFIKEISPDGKPITYEALLEWRKIDFCKRMVPVIDENMSR